MFELQPYPTPYTLPNFFIILSRAPQPYQLTTPIRWIISNQPTSVCVNKKKISHACVLTQPDPRHGVRSDHINRNPVGVEAAGVRPDCSVLRPEENARKQSQQQLRAGERRGLEQRAEQREKEPAILILMQAERASPSIEGRSHKQQHQG